MPSPSTKPPAKAVPRAPLHLPTYLLYGENIVRARAEVLHIEAIAARSRLHSWEIQPHRHEVLLQVLVIAQGKVAATLDGRQASLRAPVLIVVPPLAPHGFKFSRDVRGDVVTLLESHLRKLVAGEPELLRRLLHGRCDVLAARDAARIGEALAVLRRAHADPHEWRALAADSALTGFLVAVARAIAPPLATATPTAPSPATDLPSRAATHVAAFRDWIEQHFRAQPRMSACADALGITSTQLNRVCQRVLGHTAQSVLHTRILLEAQRDLVYTSMSIKQIAHDLGFSDAPYFTRFFERQTGVTPSAWRARELAGKG